MVGRDAITTTREQQQKSEQDEAMRVLCVSNTLSSFPEHTRITIPKESTEDMDATCPLTPSATDATRPPCQLTGTGPEVEKLREDIDRAARTDFTVLIEGETGAGKEMVAHQIHQWSRRRGGPWVAVNCAALVDTLVEAELFGIEDRTATGVRGRRGKIELAHGGTLFLDEVAELTPSVQAKLLRVLQDFTVERVGGHQPRRVNARLIVATNRSLAPLVAERAFRSDLFYRVNLLRIYVPPLRERLTDLVELAEAFLSQHQEFGISVISPTALEVMRTYAWPGNVRELFNVLADALTRAMARSVRGIGSREIGVADLPESLSRPYREVLQPSIERGDTMRAWAARYARLTLERCGNNKAKACQLLGISYHTLRSYLRRPIARPSMLASSSMSLPPDQPTPTEPSARPRPLAGTRKEDLE
jgi:transcriptional regulator with PAS, ATPase and Fis domain